jgi:VWFA-related protein
MLSSRQVRLKAPFDAARRGLRPSKGRTPPTKRNTVRRISIASALLVALTLRLSSQSPPAAGGQPPQPPVFRGGTNLVQVDAIVTDESGRPLTDLTVADFEVFDDGKPVPIDRVRFLGAAPYAGDSTLAPIRTHEDEEREASRDDVRVYAIFLDDYHVKRMEELRVVEPLLAFVRQLPATDLVGVFYPLDSVTDVNFSRDRERVIKAIRAFIGRRGDYTPTRPVENDHLRFPDKIEQLRRQITTSALEGLAVHLGGIKQGRKAVVFVSEGFVEATIDIEAIYQAASRANVAVYPLDPRGLTGEPRGSTSAQIFNGLMSERDGLELLARETGGRAIVGRNDLLEGLGQVIRDSSAYYLIAYESPHPDDGKFHRLRVHVKRAPAAVFARTGYWSFKRGQNSETAAPAVPELSPAIRAAVNELAESLRPDASEPVEARRSVLPPEPAAAPTWTLIAPPTVAVVRNRNAEPARRREFRRTDALTIRAATARQAVISARLLDRFGRPLTTLPVTNVDEVCELRLNLGSLGAGDFVVELSAGAGGETAQQFVAFRVVR